LYASSSLMDSALSGLSLRCHLVRFIPSSFPGADFKRKAAVYKKELSRIDSFPFDWTMSNIKSGSYDESFTSKNMLRPDGGTPTDEEADIIKWCSHALYGGGADTVSIPYYMIKTRADRKSP
jgi:hypothetical protein